MCVVLYDPIQYYVQEIPSIHKSRKAYLIRYSRLQVMQLSYYSHVRMRYSTAGQYSAVRDSKVLYSNRMSVSDAPYLRQL
jgi:hypothetical protein